ncbi:hypothetical protein M2169_006098 [Streptomyces sp. MJP52]|nr:hypothetical protein [Streptomyces sp. MJP52]
MAYRRDSSKLQLPRIGRSMPPGVLPVGSPVRSAPTCLVESDDGFGEAFLGVGPGSCLITHRRVQRLRRGPLDLPCGRGHLGGEGPPCRRQVSSSRSHDRSARLVARAMVSMPRR